MRAFIEWVDSRFSVRELEAIACPTVDWDYREVVSERDYRYVSSTHVAGVWGVLKYEARLSNLTISQLIEGRGGGKSPVGPINAAIQIAIEAVARDLLTQYYYTQD